MTLTRGATRSPSHASRVSAGAPLRARTVARFLGRLRASLQGRPRSTGPASRSAGPLVVRGRWALYGQLAVAARRQIPHPHTHQRHPAEDQPDVPTSDPRRPDTRSWPETRQPSGRGSAAKITLIGPSVTSWRALFRSCGGDGAAAGWVSRSRWSVRDRSPGPEWPRGCTQHPSRASSGHRSRARRRSTAGPRTETSPG